jgi:hypothetical protein
MPITLNHSNIGVQYNTGSNYIIETVKSDLYLRDTRTDITSNLLAEPTVISPVMTETVRSFIHSGGTEAQTTHTITVGQNTICDILIVGGGGGGGTGHGGGGGAGQLILIHNATLSGIYDIKVGKGGLGAISTGSGISRHATKGDSSSFGTVIAEGGGANGATSSDKNGGSGAGGDGYSADGGTTGGGNKDTTIDIFPNATVYTRGNNGGNNGGPNAGSYIGINGGGGGGAGENGTTSSTSSPFGKGGNGLSGINEINYDFKNNFGTNIGKIESDGLVWFCGGGGGGSGAEVGGGAGLGGKGGGGNGAYGANVNADNGLINTGSGGGGGSGYNGDGGNGGSGIVIIKFKTIVGASILDGITHKRLNFVYEPRYPSISADNTNLKAWYKFDGNGNDNSGNNKHLTPINISYNTSDSIVNQSSIYNGSGYFEIANDGYFSPSIFTVSLWFKFFAKYGDYQTIAMCRNAIPSSGWNIYINPSNGLEIWTANNINGTWWNISSIIADIPLNIWTHLAFSIQITSGTTAELKAYLNGSVKISTTYTYFQNTTQPLLIGVATGNVYYMRNNSLIDDFRIYNKALTPTEISQLYNIPTQNTYTLNFPVPTLADINNNSNILLRGAYDIALSTSNALIIPKSNQYIPKPTSFTNYSIERMYPPVRNFTAATTTVSGQTYGNGTYVVSFSSSTGGYEPWTCFNTSAPYGGYWAAGRYTSGVFNSTSFIVAGYLGDWLKIQLPVAIKLTKFGFLARTDSVWEVLSPKDFKIYGSNDNITWVELVNKTDAVYYNGSSIYEQTTPEITNAYTYYGLVVNKIFSSEFTALNFDEWYIYGQEVLPSSLSVRYNLLNPVLDPTGAQWTYNSSNTNVYHMGNVGIGTKSPEYNLDVRGAIYSSLGGYTQTGLTTWSIASDRRIKENIVKASYEKCLDNVKNIELYNFNFKDNCVNTNDKHQLGFIAQEVQQVYPKAVEVGKMILNTNETIDDLLSLNTTQIDYTLYGAVKNLIEKIEDIDNELGNIERNI